jgi:hypothetical protein
MSPEWRRLLQYCLIPALSLVVSYAAYNAWAWTVVLLAPYQQHSEQVEYWKVKFNPISHTWIISCLVLLGSSLLVRAILNYRHRKRPINALLFLASFFPLSCVALSYLAEFALTTGTTQHLDTAIRGKITYELAAVHTLAGCSGTCGDQYWLMLFRCQQDHAICDEVFPVINECPQTDQWKCWVGNGQPTLIKLTPEDQPDPPLPHLYLEATDTNQISVYWEDQLFFTYTEPDQ